MKPNQALDKLKQGNARFVAGTSTTDPANFHHTRTQLRNQQNPFAIILCCSDSRVPPELVFDQSLGDLFIVRVAGNIATPSQIGSIEFAVEQFGSSLVVVLGHSSCAAVAATLSHMVTQEPIASPHVASIVNQIQPNLEPLVHNHQTSAGSNQVDLIDQAVKTNIHGVARQLTEQSTLLYQQAKHNTIRLLGAHYTLDSGEVQFFE